MVEKQTFCPFSPLLCTEQDIELILDGIKYKLQCTRNGPNKFNVSLNENISSGSVDTNVRVLSDGGYLIAIGGQSHVAYLTS